MRQGFENIPEIAIGFKTIGPGGFDQTEKAGTGHGAIRAAGKQSVSLN
jgi:hypothetical protein